MHLKSTYLYQTSADKDSESPDSSVLSLSGRKDGQRTEFFFENPDKIRTPDKNTTEKIRTDRHRTKKFIGIRTESGHRTKTRQTKSGQTDTGQRILTKSGHRTDTRQNFPENPDKNRTRTGPRQCCPLNSGHNIRKCQYSRLRQAHDWHMLN